MKIKKIIMDKILKDEFLLEKLNEIVKKENITLGFITGIGALQNLNFSYYLQNKKNYITKSINKNVEVLNLTGNISIKDGEPFVHCHITVADENGNTYGGHLAEKSKVFAFEYTIFVFEGEEKIRKFDEITGLTLWEK